MEYNLFLVKCNNEECGHEFVTNSTEHTSCPSCGEQVSYSNDYIVAKTNDIFDADVESYMNDVEGILSGILIASTYVSNKETIARYSDDDCFKFNIKKSKFTDEMVELLNLSSIQDIVDMLEELVDVHSAFIYDPIIPCIARDSYEDEDGCLYESGYIDKFNSKKFYNWILNNKKYIKEFFEDEEYDEQNEK